jgi:hypothetical protein
MKFFHSILQRRSFLTFGIRAAALAVSGATVLQAQSATVGRWQPAREEQDEWLDRVPSKHRMVFDATTPEGFGYALLFAGNYYKANEDSYGLEDSDLGGRHCGPPSSNAIRVQ